MHRQLTFDQLFKKLLYPDINKTTVGSLLSHFIAHFQLLTETNLRELVGGGRATHKHSGRLFYLRVQWWVVLLTYCIRCPLSFLLMLRHRLQRKTISTELQNSCTRALIAGERSSGFVFCFFFQHCFSPLNSHLSGHYHSSPAAAEQQSSSGLSFQGHARD